jgi:RHS repeat-associated protein
MDGNLLSGQGLRREAEYEYNGQNRMTYSEVTSGRERAISAYAYDGFGRRTVTLDEGGEAMRTLYDGLSFETIREGPTFRDGTFTTRYSDGAQAVGNPGAEGMRYRWLGGEGSSGGSVYLGKDILGSVRSASNEYGVLEDRYEYDAFGKPYAGDLENGMNLGYTGKPYDTATGLYNYGYRDYKPEAARFTTVDPVRDGTNWFAYVNNDPVNWVDLWGLEACV